MRLLVLLTLVVSTISFDPTTDIEVKQSGYCDHYLTIDECADPATHEAALAQSNLIRYGFGSSVTDYEKQIKYYTMPVSNTYLNGKGSRGIYPLKGDWTYSAGCVLAWESNGAIDGVNYNFWGIRWYNMYDPLALAVRNDRVNYIKYHIDPENKNVYNSYTCHMNRPCICRKSGGLSTPDRRLPGTYYSKYEAGMTLHYQGDYDGSKTYNYGDKVVDSSTLYVLTHPDLQSMGLSSSITYSASTLSLIHI